MNRFVASTVVLLAVNVPYTALAGEGTALPRAAGAQPDSVEIAALRNAGIAYAKAMERGDRDAIAAAWTPDGKYMDAAGRSYSARELIAKEFREPGARGRGLRLSAVEIRLLTPDVGIEDGMTEHAAAPGDLAPRSRYTVVWLKRDGRWLIDSVREAALPVPPRARFAELAWMLGEFVGRLDDGSTVVVSCTTSADGNFLLREVVLSSPHRGVLTQNQRIAWDPLAKGFRSWTFDSSGAFAEATWKHEGDKWIVSTSGISAQGERRHATSTYSNIGEEGFTFESQMAAVDGQPPLNLKVRLLRRPAQP